MVTKQFKELVNALNLKKTQIVVLKGPKGVGKSVTLVALAALTRQPCLLYSVLGTSSGRFSEYVQALYQFYDSPSPAKRSNIGELLCDVFI